MVVHTKDIIDKVPPEKNMAGVIVIVASSFLHDLFHTTSPISVTCSSPCSVFKSDETASNRNFKAREKISSFYSPIQIYTFYLPLRRADRD